MYYQINIIDIPRFGKGTEIVLIFADTCSFYKSLTIEKYSQYVENTYSILKVKYSNI